ncbi:hypothetical protein HA402_005342 [Bradysia odoriphaga]|nr:hypothetical protein HA402_005342 [Bradysia odoriphaga]
MTISVEEPPHRLESEHSLLFTKSALSFIEDLITEFDGRVEKILLERDRRRLVISEGNWKPAFRNSSKNLEWNIGPLPKRLQNRKIDLGDVSPASTAYFVDTLFADVQGIQVDFDDGFCPTWRNIVLGIYNVTAAVHSILPGAPTDMTKAPTLMLRPRAFNMIEHHCLVNGKEVSGPLFDFALLMYHNGLRMSQLGIGPFFYISKIEDSIETELWNDIFVWTQNRLNIPCGTIKACVLIENILAAYCMEDILYSIKEHAIGLNCGIWDYSASIIAKFGNSPDCVIPDRNKYVNMSTKFLSSYMRLVIEVCHRRGAFATGGMAAKVLPPGKKPNKPNDVIQQIKFAKEVEIRCGVDGFMVYDMRIVDDIKELWQGLCKSDNQLDKQLDVSDIKPLTLIDIPKGGVTMDGLRQNISVALLFIYHWLSGSGIFFYNGAVEDSATAEISRSQLWQWIRFSAPIEGKDNTFVTRQLVYKVLDIVVGEFRKTMCRSIPDSKRLTSSKFILLEIITSKFYIEYITTFLNDNHKFRALHNKNDGLVSKL